MARTTTFKTLEVRSTRTRYDPAIACPTSAERAIRTLASDLDSERFWAVPLDAKNRPLGVVEVARGGPDACPVDPRETFRVAVLLNASALIVAHNHPSGDTTPSTEDKALTKRLVDCGALLGIQVLDHLIIGGGESYSFAQKGEMP